MNKVPLIKTIGELKTALADLSDDMELANPVKVRVNMRHPGRYSGFCFTQHYNDGKEYGCCTTAKASYPDSFPPVEMVSIIVKE